VTASFRALTDDIQTRRRALRDQALAAREALSPASRAALVRQLEAHLDDLVAVLQPRVLAFCWPYRAEPDLRDWMEHWLAADATRSAALPVVLERDAPLIFRCWHPGAPLQTDRHGIPFPAEGAAVVPDVVLVPLNAFDAQGFRLGYGGGYFDRTLAVMKTLTVGVGFELGRVESVLPQAHDQAMDWLLTEAGAFRAGAV
jgi:5,10-methenyltetrahydrofolate synthetase